jgi:hypothetical protein
MAHEEKGSETARSEIGCKKLAEGVVALTIQGLVHVPSPFLAPDPAELPMRKR